MFTEYLDFEIQIGALSESRHAVTATCLFQPSYWTLRGDLQRGRRQVLRAAKRPTRPAILL
jgi:hypothetical protein